MSKTQRVEPTQALVDAVVRQRERALSEAAQWEATARVRQAALAIANERIAELEAELDQLRPPEVDAGAAEPGG